MRFRITQRFFEAWLLSPAFLAFVVSLIIIALLPELFPHYSIMAMKTGLIEKDNASIVYDDADGDGFGDEIQLFPNTLGRATVKITSSDNRVMGHWLLDGVLSPRIPGLYSHDIDHDRKAEVFILIQRSDSIFLNGCRFGDKDTFLFKNLFISCVHDDHGRYDYYINSFDFSDLDKDGTSELIFSVMAGYTLRPRGIFIYNTVTSELLTRNTDGAYFGIKDVVDLDNDSIPEILCAGYAIRNYPDSADIPFHDSCAWLMVFNSRLDWYFPPTGFPGYTTNVKPEWIRFNGRKHIVLLCNNRGIPPREPQLFILDSAGNFKMQKTLKHANNGSGYSLIPSYDRNNIFLQAYGENLACLNEQLDTTFTIRTGEYFHADGYQPVADLKGGADLFKSDCQTGKVLMTNEDFSVSSVFDLPFRTNLPARASIIANGDKRPAIFIQGGNQYAILHVDRNPYRYARLPFYAGIYIMVLGFILLIRRIQRLQEERKKNLERRVSRLQLLLVQNQLDPHFTFNTINSISAAILTDQPEEANRKLLALARMMRSYVSDSDTLTRSLEEETDFLRNYLDLMKNRLGDLFSYTIEIEPDANLQWQVPKMITQIYVENAIRHGLMPRENRGMITIRISGLHNQHFSITVEDNGIGRDNARRAATGGTGKGMQIMEQIFTAFNQVNREKIYVEITDLMDENRSPKGTRVTLLIPAGLKISL